MKAMQARSVRNAALQAARAPPFPFPSGTRPCTRGAAPLPFTPTRQGSASPASATIARRRVPLLTRAFAEERQSGTTPTRTAEPGQDVRSILIASDDPVVTNGCISWVMGSLIRAGEQHKVHLLHCLPPDKRPPHPYQHPRLFGEEERLPAADPAVLQCEEEMRQLLGSRLQQAGVPYEVHAAHGDPSLGHTGRVGALLCRWAEDLNCSALVITSKSRGGLSELFRGSVANYATHHCSRPVVVLHCPAEHGPGSSIALGTFSRNIVVAIDSTEQSVTACRWTLDNLYTPGDTLHLTHIIPSLPPITEVPPFEGMAVMGPGVSWELAEQEEKVWKESQAARFKGLMEEAGADYTFNVITECTQDPVTSISEDLCLIAARLQAKALVCTGRTHTEVSELLFNSVANYVAHHCHQPVVVLPAPR